MEDIQKTIKHYDFVIIVEDTIALLNSLLPLIPKGNLEKVLATLSTTKVKISLPHLKKKPKPK